MSGQDSIPDNEARLIIYRTEDGKTRVGLRAIEGSAWLTQMEIAELFSSSKQNISLHIKKILMEEELAEDSVVKYCLTTAADEKRTSHWRLLLYLPVRFVV